MIGILNYKLPSYRWYSFRDPKSEQENSVDKYVDHFVRKSLTNIIIYQYLFAPQLHTTTIHTCEYPLLFKNLLRGILKRYSDFVFEIFENSDGKYT